MSISERVIALRLFHRIEVFLGYEHVALNGQLARITSWVAGLLGPASRTVRAGRQTRFVNGDEHDALGAGGTLPRQDETGVPLSCGILLLVEVDGAIPGGE
jgi:hypothetical protein